MHPVSVPGVFRVILDVLYTEDSYEKSKDCIMALIDFEYPE
jgi:hypothetical protein